MFYLAVVFRLLEVARCRTAGNLPKFTSAEKICLRLSWDQFVAGDKAKTGFNMFLRYMYLFYPL